MSRMNSGLRKAMPLVGVLALVLPLLLVFATPVAAATLCVNTGGTGGCYGSIQDAVDNAGAGDLINVYPGTYDESVDLGGHSGGLRLRTVNNAGDPTPGTATVDGGSNEAFHTSIEHAGNITINGFVVESAGDDGIDVAANSNIVIRNVTASNTDDDGIDVDAGGDVTISDCTANSTSSDGIYIDDAGGNVSISNCTANGNYDENIDVDEAEGNVTITGCTANNSIQGYGIEVDDVDGNLEVSTCTANGNDSGGMDIEDVLGSVTVTDCTANSNDGEGIEVEGEEADGALREGEEESDLDEDEEDVDRVEQSVSPSANGGNVTIENCTANDNADDGISVCYIEGEASISNCTASGNGDDGIEPNEISGAVEVSACVCRDNGDDGVDLWYMVEADSINVNGNIICGNASDGLELNVEGVMEARIEATDADATGNWWGCPGGPGAAGCDTVDATGGSVDYTPWIGSITGSSSVDPAIVGSPAALTFQFSGGPPAVCLGEGPGDLRGPAPFTVSTDNGTVVSSGFIGGSQGRVEVTLTPAHTGTATVNVDGPCGLDESIVLNVAAEEFVPEPGSVMLLASGLMGLAGYAGLRIRKR
jgi:parallel beta-helix repeat protein